MWCGGASLIPALWRPKQVDSVNLMSAWTTEWVFQDSQSYILRPCLKTTTASYQIIQTSRVQSFKRKARAGNWKMSHSAAWRVLQMGLVLFLLSLVCDSFFNLKPKIWRVFENVEKNSWWHPEGRRESPPPYVPLGHVLWFPRILLVFGRHIQTHTHSCMHTRQT